MKVLVDLGTCFHGFSGVAQETRLVFKLISEIPGIEVGGLLLHPENGPLGFRTKSRKGHISNTVKKQSDYLIALESFNDKEASGYFLGGHLGRVGRIARSLWGCLTESQKVLVRYAFKTIEIDANIFYDYLWSTLFSNTLQAKDFALVMQQKFYGVGLSWAFLDLNTRMGMPTAKIDTTGWDVFISANPFPARVSHGTRLIVRYHDAIPVLLPHTIDNMKGHQSGFFKTLKRNVRNAMFICGAEPANQDLLMMFPEIEKRTTTIPDLISDGYFKVNQPDALKTIIQTRSPNVVVGAANLREDLIASRSFTSKFNGDYIIAVGTLEPRKNYPTIIRGWEQLRRRTGRDVKLVVVANRGWKIDEILLRMHHHIPKGNLFHLEKVTLPELRILYSHALACVSASYAEGFNFSGIEAMCCGTPAVLSDLRTHRWVYEDSALYFDPYSASSLTDSLERLIVSKEGKSLGESLLKRGMKILERYREQAIRPMWEEVLSNVHNGKSLGRTE